MTRPPDAEPYHDGLAGLDGIAPARPRASVAVPGPSTRLTTTAPPTLTQALLRRFWYWTVMLLGPAA